jgi:predicted signal transduction protein with EAL and GGDEF domain
VLAERIRRRLEQARVGPGWQRLTASFGIVQLRDGETIDSLLYRADQALYQAKSSGKNRTVSSFSDVMRVVLEDSPGARKFLKEDPVSASGTDIDPMLRNL